MTSTRKMFYLILVTIGLSILLSLLGWFVHPFFFSLTGILVPVIIICGGILILRKMKP